MPAAGSHYFDDDPELPSQPTAVEVWLPDRRLTLTTDRGVFGRSGLDPGTKLLLTRGPAPASVGTLVDVGCGTGAIAITLALRSPDAVVWAVDVNRRARELCASNAAANRANVRVVSPEELPEDFCVDEIWSNPPIRIGKPALHALLTAWFARLAPGGRAVLVVHKHLGSDSLQRWITELGLPCERSLSSGGYRLLVATRPL
jgi:16S rRNA (guanine1207-N2)-methyltransferase